MPRFNIITNFLQFTDDEDKIMSSLMFLYYSLIGYCIRLMSINLCNIIMGFHQEHIDIFK